MSLEMQVAQYLDKLEERTGSVSTYSILKEGAKNGLHQRMLADLLEVNEAMDDDDLERLEKALLTSLIRSANTLVLMGVPLDQRLMELHSLAIETYKGKATDDAVTVEINEV